MSLSYFTSLINYILYDTTLQHLVVIVSEVKRVEKFES